MSRVGVESYKLQGYQPVVTLVPKEKEDAATLKESKFDRTSNVLSVTFLGSSTQIDEITLTLQVYTRKKGQLHLRTRPKIVDWRLGVCA